MLSGEQIQFANSCLICVPIALFIYDWMLIIGDEVHRGLSCLTLG